MSNTPDDDYVLAVMTQLVICPIIGSATKMLIDGLDPDRLRDCISGLERARRSPGFQGRGYTDLSRQKAAALQRLMEHTAELIDIAKEYAAVQKAWSVEAEDIRWGRKKL